MSYIVSTVAYTTRTTCRVCGSMQLEPLFSLGKQYVSNFVDAKGAGQGRKVPIELELCTSCTLVQLKHTAPQEILYRRHYWYRSGVTQTMRDALRDVTQFIEDQIELHPGDVVLDIGSNDGTLLRSYSTFTDNLIKVGVEPAKNLAEEGRKGIAHLIEDFWSYEGFRKYAGEKKAKVITAIGMFYDLEDPNQFIADVSKALANDGLFVAQLMCLKNMINLNDVGNLAHEHLEFYSIRSLQYLLSKHQLRIFRIETNDVNGESYRIYATHNWMSYKLEPSISEFVHEVLNLEELSKREEGLNDPSFYHKYFETMERNRIATYNYIMGLVQGGKTVWVYGASTKGNVILQYYGLDNTLITGASDRSPEKWGKYTVGTMIPIVSEEEAREADPDYFLVLPYAFIDEFVEREAEWRRKGGKFIVPLPELHVI